LVFIFHLHYQLKSNEIMKNIFLILLMFTSLTSISQTKDFYKLSAKTIDGNDFDFSSLKGKKVMIVNVASKCGLTPQYEDLQKLNELYGGENFVILGFPANDFLKQEPGTNTEIKEFCTSKFNVTFQMMEKISVKGDEIDPIYKWLTTKELNGRGDYEMKWNFQKFFIDEEGKLVGKANPIINPLDDQIVKWIKGEAKEVDL